MLSYKQYQAVEAHFICETVQDIAKKVGVSASSIYAWRNKPEFAKVLEEYRKEFENTYRRKLVRLAVKSLRNFEKHIDNGSEVSIHKINDIFIKSKALDDSDEIKRRLAELEKIASENPNATKEEVNNEPFNVAKA